MSQRIGGSGVGLPSAQFLFPTQINNAGPDSGTPVISLAPGDSFTIPPGDFLVNRAYSFIQHKDPISAAWRGFATPLSVQEKVYSDGSNFRIANMTGCPVAAIVVAGGSGYAQSTTSVSSSTGGSTWQAIVGGMMSVNTIARAGSGYGVAPLLLPSQPPSPGVQATGFCVITSGTLSAVTLTNVGAGYTASQTLIAVPNPYDPNLSSTTAIVNATVVLAPIGSGSIAAVLCTNNGAPASPTLTVGGAGSSASVVAVICQTMASGSVSAGGAGLNNAALLTTVGGLPSNTPQWVNPATDLSQAIPRPAQASLFGSGGSLISVATIIDKGLFFGTPTVLVLPSTGNLQTTAATVTVTLGSTADTILLQPV